MANSKLINKITSIDSSITLPGSKSITNRALALAAMCDEPSEMVNPLRSDDTEAFVECLNNMGANVAWEDNSIAINEVLPFGYKGTVNCRDAGTAARFLPPVAAALGSTINFEASEQLKARPMLDLLNGLREQGSTIVPENATHLPFSVSSEGITGGNIEVPGNTSSQFLSGLLMASPFAKTTTIFNVDDLISKPYVDLTISMMQDYGLSIQRNGYKSFTIPNTGHYTAPEDSFEVEADASTASYFFAAALATKGKITVSNIRRDSLQGDIRILDIFELMGATVTDDDEGVTVIGPQVLTGVDVDMNDITDVMMTLAAIAPLAETPTRINNVGHARLKESDRIDAVVKGLKRLGIIVEEGQDWLTIHPGSASPSSIDTFEDHRIAMSFSVLGLATGAVTIENPDCVKKTCPEFFELIDSL